MTMVNDLHKKWMKDPEYRRAHEELQPESALARALTCQGRSPGSAGVAVAV